jgi:hypothetical protein
MSKVDRKAEMREIYKPSAGAPAEVDVPELRTVQISGAGDPNTSEEYKEAVAALYALSYALKFRLKKSTGVDYTVMPLEGLWWLPDSQRFEAGRKSDMQWTALIVQPDEVTHELFEEVRDEVMRKKKDNPAIARAQLGTLREGRAAQILHVGPWDDEPGTIEKVHNFIDERGGSLTGKHHEIYLSDPTRTAPEKLKTIIRQPFGGDG